MNRTGMTFTDGEGNEWILVPTPGEDGGGHWAGPFDTRESAVAFCPIFGQAVEAPNEPSLDEREDYRGRAYA